MIKSSITLFLDIDGVFNISTPNGQTMMLDHKHVWPIPMTIPLLQAIDHDASITPVWITHWGEGAHAWNEYADTRRWEVAYPLAPHTQTTMGYLFPILYDKPLAIQYYLRQHPGLRSIWMQDGFPTVSFDWARQNRVHLIDTTQEPLRRLLLHSYTDAETLLSMILSSAQEARV